MQQLRHLQKETENSIIPETLLMAILLYFIILLYFVSYYLYSNVLVSLYMLAILCCHTIDWDIFLRYWCLSQIYYYYYIINVLFTSYFQKCSQNNLCKRLGIPECILLVTQRMTKYPLLIEPIMKTTKGRKGYELRKLHYICCCIISRLHVLV